MKFIRGVPSQKKPPSKPAKVNTPAHRSSPWHAVSIVTKSTSCEAARALRATRFLSVAAPRLPMPECTAGGSCPCAYKHHEDRRGPPRRKDELSGLKRNAKGAQERRTRGSRRSTD
jgi:hypothetical protein